jgi:hypothetical protein
MNAFTKRRAVVALLLLLLFRFVPPCPHSSINSAPGAVAAVTASVLLYPTFQGALDTRTYPQR